MRLYAALTATSLGAWKMSFDKNFAVSIPPRFLLHNKDIHMLTALSFSKYLKTENRRKHRSKPYVKFNKLQVLHSYIS